MSWSADTDGSRSACADTSRFAIAGASPSTSAGTSAFDAGASLSTSTGMFSSPTADISPSATAGTGASLFDACVSPSASADTFPFGVGVSKSAGIYASWSASTSSSWSTDVGVSLSADAASASLFVGNASVPLFLSTSFHIPRFASIVFRSLSSLDGLPNSSVIPIITKTETKLEEWLKTANLDYLNLSAIPTIKGKRSYNSVFITTESLASSYVQEEVDLTFA